MKRRVKDKSAEYKYWPMVDRFMGYNKAKVITAGELIEYAKEVLTREYKEKMEDEEHLLEYGRMMYLATKKGR